jgi:hypothetical protein
MSHVQKINCCLFWMISDIEYHQFLSHSKTNIRVKDINNFKLARIFSRWIGESGRIEFLSKISYRET